ncbi:MAG: hypothetical protein J6S53_06855 [Lentisphaeria bacterium]|nr:hypothetical protein [Lentisphaeria bacterium]
MMKNNISQRMASWWLRREILDYPDKKISDEIRKRADVLAEGGCDSAIMFGAHFRWDYMPVWERLHDYIAEVVEVLHERNMVFWDHHSCVLTARPSHGKNESSSLAKRDHVFLKEINEFAENWEFMGEKLNSWRMKDLFTGQAVFLPQYAADEFCINNPSFRSAYRKYLQKLLAETSIDALMCDDAFFYPGFRACICPHCLEKFGQEVPPHTDLTFWGNWNNEDFRKWIAFRYASVGDFNQFVQASLPENFPLMNCCSGSVSAGCNTNALSGEEFLKGGNRIMLEMCGNTPAVDGTYWNNLSSQLHHLALAKEKNASCIGLGYGFYPDTAQFIWAFNKFLGSGTWISTLKHRLGLPDEIIYKELPDEGEIIKKAFNFEKNHPEYFSGTHKTDTAVYFSRSTHDFAGGCQVDYVLDYMKTVQNLFEENKDFDVVTSIPDEMSSIRVLYLPSAACLSQNERKALDGFLQRGNRIYASGPCGIYDENGNKSNENWIAETLLLPFEREKFFPEGSFIFTERNTIFCGNEKGLREVRKNLFWNPERQFSAEESREKHSLLPRFFHRTFLLENGKKVTHFLSSSLKCTIDEANEKKRTLPLGNTLINSLLLACQEKEEVLPESLEIPIETRYDTVKLIFPLAGENGIITEEKIKEGKIVVPLSPEKWYFIIAE